MAISKGNLISDSLLRELRKNVSTVRNDNNVNNNFIGTHSQQTRKTVRIVGAPSGDWLLSGYTSANAFYAAEEVLLSGYTSAYGYLSGASFSNIENSVYGYSLSSSYPPICNLFEVDKDVLSAVPLSTNVEIYSWGDSAGNPIWYFDNNNVILQYDTLTDMTVAGKSAAQILSAPVTWKYNDDYDALSATKITFIQSLSFSPDLSAFLSFSRNATIDNFGKMISITAAFSGIVVSTTSCSG